MLGDIDPYKKPVKPRIFVSKPDGTIISKLSEAFNIKQNIKLTSLNEISFDLPYYVNIYHKEERNPNVDLLKERYLLEVWLGSQKELYLINKINDNMDEEKDHMSVSAFSLGYELKDKLVRALKLESKNARQSLNEVLSETLWAIDHLDPDFEKTYRDFDFTNTTVLDAVFKIAETFNAIIQWNTIMRTLRLIKPEYTGINKGLKFSYGHYLKSLGKESDADEMVTRLKVFGKDGLSIERVNPTGQNYLEDFSYFMYPFERDHGRVLSSSHYMSDSLCHALLDYNDLITSKQGEFERFLSDKEKMQEQLSEFESQMDGLRIQESLISKTVLLQQYDNTMWFSKFSYDGERVIETTQLNPSYCYAVFCKVANKNNLEVRLDGIKKNIVANQWVALNKLQLTNLTTYEISGSAKDTEVFIQIAKISDDEYSQSSNEEALIEKYSLDNKQMQITAKQQEIDLLQSQMDVVDKDIQNLTHTLAVENNFTFELIRELNTYVIEREFSDENYIHDKDLYKDAKERFDELRQPQTSVNIDIVNFLEIVEEQHNWDKLRLGDEVIIEYEKIGVKVTAKIIEISFDYEEMNINLTIANVTNIDDESKKLAKYIEKGLNTSTKVDMEKFKWDQNKVDLGVVGRILDNFWNEVTREINMANNEFVTIDHKGITIIDPNDPNRFLRATHGALGLTRSGGLKYETAITPDGIIAERLMGKIILGTRVIIGDDDGIWLTDGPLTTITDRCEREAMKIGLYEQNPDKFGISIHRYEQDNCNNTSITNRILMDAHDGMKVLRKNGADLEPVAWLDANGFMNLKGVKIDYASGTLNNGITLDNIDGLMITRSDNAVRTKVNATEGISIERFENNRWDKKFFADLNGQFYSHDLIAKRLRIVNDLDDLMLDSNIHYLNIGRFEHIITDGKLTPIEKLTLKQEWETIQTEYQKLKYQAEQYEYSDRDKRTISHIHIPPFVTAFQELGNYVEPLLADMNVTTPVDRNEFKAKFQGYYDQAKRIINEITNVLKYNSWQLGVPYNKVTMDAQNGLLVERSDNKFKAIFNATHGILLQKNNGGSWIDQFKVGTDGVIEARGLRIFDTNVDMLNGKLTNGINIDPINGIIVTRSDGVVKTGLNATRGIFIQRNNQDVFWADTNGVLHAIDLVAKRLKITADPMGGSTEDTLLIDASQRKLYLNNFDVEGVGRLDAQNIIVNNLISGEAIINDLTVNRLKTLPKNLNVGGKIDYVEAQDNYIRWITAAINGRTQAKDYNGRLLYWTDAKQKYATTQATAYPMYEYSINNKEIKREISFMGSGAQATPRDIIGAGDGGVNNSTDGKHDSAKVYIEKGNGYYNQAYYSSNYAKKRSLEFRDSRIDIYSEDGEVLISGKDYEVYAENGSIVMKMSNGSLFEMNSKGLKANINGDINFTASGRVNINGSEIHLN
ncbi:phage tail spike protein [Paenibacillus sp. J2TS4]|uniref:phage tail spike protein n=1 Tax=Paenibacillus sp. J2TS4 TaxID=2807194 RepID=UPI001B192B6D|nr:phage tail spike protein [Paenibacillus sp. J2TS4]GIP32602.1 hypothetical protein J2TS4_18120 [Paenibacillus sp. J2TS4]